MQGNFYDDVRALAEALIADGHETLGEEVKLAVEAGSTGSEILMRLRKVFEGALEGESLSAELRERVRRELEAVKRVLC